MKYFKNSKDSREIKIALNLNITREEDEYLRSDLNQPEWQEVSGEDALRSMKMGRFRGIIERQSLYDIAKIYAIVGQDVRMRIMLHLHDLDQRTLVEILKNRELRKFYRDFEAQKTYMILLGFEILLTVV